MASGHRNRSAKGEGEKAEAGFKRRASQRDGEMTAAREEAFRRAIFAIPAGRVNSYGGVALAAGYPRYHRAVARLLQEDHWDQLPWHRVLGSDGEIKTSGASAKEQKGRLRAEGVRFAGKKVDRRAFLSGALKIQDHDD